MRIIKIPFNTETPCSVHEVSEPGSKSCLDDIKKIINIEWAEIVLTNIRGEDPRRDYCLIVDEVGKLKEKWEDKINLRASQFYNGALHGDPIVGDVVICAREWTESFGECDLAGLSTFEAVKLMLYLKPYKKGEPCTQ